MHGRDTPGTITPWSIAAELGWSQLELVSPLRRGRRLWCRRFRPRRRLGLVHSLAAVRPGQLCTFQRQARGTTHLMIRDSTVGTRDRSWIGTALRMESKSLELDGIFSRDREQRRAETHSPFIREPCNVPQNCSGTTVLGRTGSCSRQTGSRSPSRGSNGQGV